jgi:hypothetical protein
MLPQFWNSLPRLQRFMIRHFMTGVLLGWAAAYLMMTQDVAGIGTLLARYDSPALVTLFFAKGGLYFGTLAMGVAVMNMGHDEPGGGGMLYVHLKEQALQRFEKPARIAAGKPPVRRFR